MTTTALTGITALVLGLGVPALATAQTAPAAPAPAAKTAAVPSARAAAAPTSFNWYAEVVSFDAVSRTLTAKAKAEPHVAGRASSLKAGERVVLGWSAFKGEADAVRSVTAEKATVAESGYLVRATLVGVDAAARSLTFSTKVPAAVAATLGAAKAGTPVRVGAPLVQPGPDAVITAVAVGRTAPARPAPVVAVKPVESARQMAGAWEVSTNMMGNAIKLTCTFTQAGVKLDGTCNGPGPFANLPADGKIDGDEVSFGFSISQPVSLKLLHVGKLDAAGTKVEGTLDLMGNATPFVAAKK
ncbi:MAG: hypothetical protein AB7P99_20155 [Vicinamibacterales bacterium]